MAAFGNTASHIFCGTCNAFIECPLVDFLQKASRLCKEGAKNLQGASQSQEGAHFKFLGIGAKMTIADKNGQANSLQKCLY